MRRARDIISPAEVKQIIKLDDICLDFVHEITTRDDPPYKFLRILSNGAASEKRSSRPAKELVKSERGFRSELRRIFDEQLQMPDSSPVHEVILDWMLDAWSRAMFGPSTYIAVDDARGVLVACARQDISKGKMIEGIEDLVCGLNEERDIHALGINDEFAVFDDGVTVWLGPMRLIGYGCKKCQNTRYVKQPIDCNINLPDGADLQFLAASRPVLRDAILWTYPGDTYTLACGCPPPEKKHVKVARAKGVDRPKDLTKKRKLSLYVGSGIVPNDEVRVSPPAKRVKRGRRSLLSVKAEAIAQDRLGRERSLDLDRLPEDFQRHTMSPEVIVSVTIPPRKRLPSPSMSPEPEAIHVEHDVSEMEQHPMQDPPSDLITTSETPTATIVPTSLQWEISSSAPDGLEGPYQEATVPDKWPKAPRVSLPKKKGRKEAPMAPPICTEVQSAAPTPVPVTTSANQHPSSGREPSALVSAAILSSLTRNTNGRFRRASDASSTLPRQTNGRFRKASDANTLSSAEEASIDIPQVETPLWERAELNTEMVKISDQTLQDSSERLTYIPSPAREKRKRPKMYQPVAIKDPAPIDRTFTSKTKQTSADPVEKLQQAQLQLDWLLATRDIIEAEKTRAETEKQWAESENEALRSITDSLQLGHNATLQENAKLVEENTALKEELEKLRPLKEENTQLATEIQQLKAKLASRPATPPPLGPEQESAILLEQLDVANAMLRRADAAMSQLESRLSEGAVDNEAPSQALRMKIDDLEAEANLLQGQLQTVRREAEATRKASDQRIQHLQDKNAELNKQILEIQQTSRIGQSDVAKLQEQNAVLLRAVRKGQDQARGDVLPRGQLSFYQDGHPISPRSTTPSSRPSPAPFLKPSATKRALKLSVPSNGHASHR